MLVFSGYVNKGIGIGRDAKSGWHLETTTEMELLRFGGSTTTTITTNTKTSENTKPEEQPR